MIQHLLLPWPWWLRTFINMYLANIYSAISVDFSTSTACCQRQVEKREWRCIRIWLRLWHRVSVFIPPEAPGSAHGCLLQSLTSHFAKTPASVNLLWSVVIICLIFSASEVAAGWHQVLTIKMSKKGRRWCLWFWSINFEPISFNRQALYIQLLTCVSLAKCHRNKCKTSSSVAHITHHLSHFLKILFGVWISPFFGGPPAAGSWQ